MTMSQSSFCEIQGANGLGFEHLSAIRLDLSLRKTHNLRHLASLLVLNLGSLARLHIWGRKFLTLRQKGVLQ